MNVALPEESNDVLVLATFWKSSAASTAAVIVEMEADDAKVFVMPNVAPGFTRTLPPPEYAVETTNSPLLTVVDPVYSEGPLNTCMPAPTLTTLKFAMLAPDTPTWPENIEFELRKPTARMFPFPPL